jgi:hypothetical protein
MFDDQEMPSTCSYHLSLLSIVTPLPVSPLKKWASIKGYKTFKINLENWVIQTYVNLKKAMNVLLTEQNSKKRRSRWRKKLNIYVAET